MLLVPDAQEGPRNNRFLGIPSAFSKNQSFISPWAYRTNYYAAYCFANMSMDKQHSKNLVPLLQNAHSDTSDTITLDLGKLINAPPHYDLLIYRTNAQNATDDAPIPTFANLAFRILEANTHKPFIDSANPFSGLPTGPSLQGPISWTTGSSSNLLLSLPFRTPTFYSLQVISTSDGCKQSGFLGPVLGPVQNLIGNAPIFTFTPPPIFDSKTMKIIVLISGSPTGPFVASDLSIAYTSTQGTFTDTINSLYTIANIPAWNPATVVPTKYFTDLGKPCPTAWTGKTSYSFSFVDKFCSPGLGSPLPPGAPFTIGPSQQQSCPDISLPITDLQKTYDLVVYRTDNHQDTSKDPALPVAGNPLSVLIKLNDKYYVFQDTLNPFL